MGLSPIAPDKNKGSSIVEALSSADIIDKEKVTFFINTENVQSSVTFGSVPDNIRNGIVDLDLYEKYDNWWTVKLRGFHYGGKNMATAGTNYAILDTGTSLMAISKSDY